MPLQRRGLLAALGAGLAAWLSGDGPALAGAAPSRACPRLEAHSLSLCDRCVSTDLCPQSDDGASFVCDPFTKLCINSNWTAAEVEWRCGGHDSSKPETWHAMCKLACRDERAPYGCAVNYCLNEDFPCNWVPGCNPPFGLTPQSTHCMRSCTDHESLLKTSFGLTTCSAAIQRHGCHNSWHRISDYCPHSCRNSQECGYRCGRDEAASPNGTQCWDFLRLAPGDTLMERCLEAIRLGMDCHCKCGHVYMLLGGISSRSFGGAFTTVDRYDGKGIALNVSVTAGQPFALDLTGEKMRDADIAMISGPRAKVVPKGESCSTATNIPGLTGLDCHRPPGLNLDLACVTPPSAATPFLHRWKNITIKRCGEFDVCHCNGNCGQRTTWRRAGVLRVSPSMAVSEGVNKVYPGCDRWFTTQAPSVQATQNETRQDEIVKTSMSISGGLAPETGSVEAVKYTLVEFLQSYSALLAATLPQASDVSLRLLQARRLRSPGGRSLQSGAGSCRDNDAVFADESAKVGMPLASCSHALTFLSDDKRLLCNDPTLKDAAEKGCAATCGFCGQTSTSAAPAAAAPTPAPGPTVSTSQAPTLNWPGGPSALRFQIELQTRTNWHTDYVLARLVQLRDDTVVQASFIHKLHERLHLTAARGAVLPQKLMVHLVGGVVREPVLVQPPPKEERTWQTSTTIWIIVGAAGGGSVLLALAGVAIWYYYTRDFYETKVASEGAEVVTVSDGGYRVKKSWVEGDAPPPQTPKPPRKPRCQCLRRWLGRCHQRFCARKLRRVLPTQGGEGEIAVGSIVKLMGLSQAHYNGLKGTVVAGPLDNGRFMVDLVVVEDEDMPEHQVLSFRPENLRLWIPPSEPPAGAGGGPQQPARGPGSYRAQAAAGVRGPGSYRTG